MDCKKCPYFMKNTERIYGSGAILIGFCKLRQKSISDETVKKEFCKDRAVISPKSKDAGNADDSRGTITF